MSNFIERIKKCQQNKNITNMPMVTYFKNVVRKHTNFAIENINVPFNNGADFGKRVVVDIPTAGDLMSRIYIKVTLPSLNIKRLSSLEGLQSLYDVARTNLEIMDTFLSVNRSAYIEARQLFVATNVPDGSFMIQAVNDIFSDVGNVPKVDAFIQLMIDVSALDDDIPFIFDDVSMASLISLLPLNSGKQEVIDQMDIGLRNSGLLRDYFRMITIQRRVDCCESDLALTAWVEYIGFALIDKVEFKVGGKVYDSHGGEWMYVRSAMFDTVEKRKSLYDIIGHKPSLYTLDRSPKDQTILYIPLYFWFCNDIHNSLPVSSLQNEQITLDITFSKITDVLRVNDGNIPSRLHMDASLCIDYIFLDQPEKYRFAQSNIEYLIVQLQTISVCDIVDSTYTIEFSQFYGTCIELIWFIRRQDKEQRFDFSANDLNNRLTSQTCDTITFNFDNVHSSVTPHSGLYYNTVSCINVHTTTPPIGVYCHSFALSPEDSNPSGSINIEKFENATLTFTTSFTDDEPYDIYFYSRNYNILSVKNGSSSLMLR